MSIIKQRYAQIEWTAWFRKIGGVDVLLREWNSEKSWWSTNAFVCARGGKLLATRHHALEYVRITCGAGFRNEVANKLSIVVGRLRKFVPPMPKFSLVHSVEIDPFVQSLQQMLQHSAYLWYVSQTTRVIFLLALIIIYYYVFSSNMGYTLWKYPSVRFLSRTTLPINPGFLKSSQLFHRHPTIQHQLFKRRQFEYWIK